MRMTSTPWFGGAAHKDIYYQGHYHDEAYLGSELVWAKYENKFKFQWRNDGFSYMGFRVSGSVTVQWGDGEVTTVEKAEELTTVDHNFRTSTGVKTITITGDLTDIELPNHVVAVNTPFPWSMRKVTNFSNKFANEGSLVSVPDDLFKYCTEGVDFSGCFRSCEKLKKAPKFKNLPNAVNFSECFSYCTSLKEPPSFVNLPNAADFSECFYAAAFKSGKIAAPIFKNLPNATNFSWCLMAAFREISSALFENCPKASNFDHFFGSSWDAPIYITGPAFKDCIGATSFSSLFWGNSNLKSITAPIFENCRNVKSFEGCFSICENLTTISAPLFKNCTNAENFNGCFKYCDSLKTIPANLFEGCVHAKSFNVCFRTSGGTDSYMGISAIPEGLFEDCTEAESFSNCFGTCGRLTALPKDIFQTCVNAKNFNNCFSWCDHITGDVPEIWETHPDADGTDCFEGCTSAANYWDIPDDWK